MKALPSGVHFSVAFLKDKTTDSFLKKKKVNYFIFHSYINIHTYMHTHTYINTHTYTHTLNFG